MTTISQILSLARAGNPVRAWERFVELGLDRVGDDVKVLTLKGRLLKDLGNRAVGDERLRLFRKASAAYLAANVIKADSYPLINAATLALLSQDAVHTAELAEQVLERISGNPDEGETPYWREATRAEALLLLGRKADAQAALAQGIAKLPRAWEDHAATIGQFERILAAQGDDAHWLDAFRPAPAVHFSGLIGLDPQALELSDAIRDIIAANPPGFAYGALAAGADILLAEALIEAGALLHVILPFARERFRAVSVEPYGADWVERFDALIDQAEVVEELWDSGGEGEEWFAPLVEAANLAAMGQTLRRAETLHTHAHALAIKAQGELVRSHLRQWQAAGLPLHLIETKRATGGARSGDGSPQVLAALAATGLSQTAQKGMSGLTFSQRADVVQWTGPIDDCLAAAFDLQNSETDASLGLNICPFTTDGAMESAARLAARLAQSARAGELYADNRSAMVAKVLTPQSRVEEMGEMGSLSGPITVCAIAPNAG